MSVPRHAASVENAAAGRRKCVAAQSGTSAGGEQGLRAWLEFLAQTAIDWLDELDASTDDLEDEPDGEQDLV